YQFYNGYRTVTRPDGAEERVAVLGERFRDVSPGRLPRTLDELRAGQERSDADQRQHVEIARNDAPEGPSLEDALDQMFEEAEEEEQNAQQNNEQDQPPTLVHAPYTFNSNDSRSSHRVAGQVMRSAPPRNPEYQARRIAALRRELLRMRNGIERVISGLRDLGEPIPDHSDTTNRLSELGRSLDAMSVRDPPLSSPNSNSANRETRAPVVGSVYRDPELTSVQQRFDEAQRQLEQAQRFRDQAAVEFQLAQASHTETSEILEGAELDLTEHREQVSQLRREQRTAENYARLFGTREDMETQGAEYESPIGGMFTRAYERFRVAEEVRQDERTLRQVLEHEQLATGPLFANDDDNEEPHPAADTVYEDRLNEYYSMLRQQDWVQNIRQPTSNNDIALDSTPSNVDAPDPSTGAQAEAVTSEQVSAPAAPQQMSTLERLLRNTPEPQRSSIIARMEQNGTAAAIRESESGNHLDVWRRLRDAYAPFRGNWEEESESSDDEDRARGGLDAEDSGRPEPKEDADMTLKLDCKICENMENQKTLLSELRLRSAIDCDTLDVEVAQALGPFVDCTSNQAIVNIELQKPNNEPLIIESIQQAKQLYPQYATEATFEQFASEVMAVNLSARMIPYLTGRALIQTNPYHAYSTAATIANAKRIIAIYKTVVPEFPSNRVCIKIPSTWEGIQACKVLEQEGIVTLATTLFSMEQAAAAHLAGCSYIAPYVNELPVHFVPGHVDNDKGFALTRSCQSLYSRLNSKTLVMPASLTSVEECLKVSGAHHITISPPLLAALASTPTSASSSPHFFDQVVEGEDKEDAALLETVTREDSYRIRYTRCKNGAAEKKLVDAINIFSDCQDATEELVRRYVK
ncbi:transaldolase, partial [Aureobasidium melanogenum]